MNKYEYNKFYYYMGQLLKKARKENNLDIIPAAMRTGYKPENLMALENGEPAKWSGRTLWSILWLFEQYDRRVLIMSVKDRKEDKHLY